MSKEEKKEAPAEEKKEERETEAGIPVPPGYTCEGTDFRTPARRKLVAQRMELLSKSITFTPLINSVMSCIMLLIMGSSLVMAMSSMMTLCKSGFGAITAAMAPNHRLNWTNRMIMMAIGMGLILYVGWRAHSLGLIGADDDYVPPERPPMFFDVR